MAKKSIGKKFFDIDSEDRPKVKGKKKKVSGGKPKEFGSMFNGVGKKPKNVSAGAKAYLKRVGGRTL